MIVVGLALLLLAGGIVAGNMGFKLTAPISKLPAGGSASGTNYLALPWNPQKGLDNARNLFVSLGTGTQFVFKHRKIDDAFEQYTFGGGTLPPNGWDLKPGEGYIVKVGLGFQPFVAMGSHLPDEKIQFLGGGSPNSISGTNYYAPPYHGVAADARELFVEIGGGVQFLFKHRPVDDAFEQYTFGGGTVPPNGWPIVPGTAYVVKIGGTEQIYQPLHY